MQLIDKLIQADNKLRSKDMIKTRVADLILRTADLYMRALIVRNAENIFKLIEQNDIRKANLLKKLVD